MMEHTLITIGRQFGSGGHEVGNRLAERLDIPLYDHNLLRMAARELGVSDEDVAKVDETMLGRFLSGYVAGSGEYTAFMSGEEAGRPLSDRLFEAQSELIRRLADYVLGDYSNVINTFIYAYKDDRLNRIMDIYKLTEKQAADKIKKTDRERKLYYEARTGREWGGIESNSMLFNTSLLGIDGVTDALEAIYRKWESRG